MDELTDAFLAAQSSQISKWLLNPQLYAAVAVLLALSLWRPMYRWTARTTTGVVHDYSYGVFHTLVTAPLIVLYAMALDDIVTQWMPGIRLELLSALPAPAQVITAIVVNDLLGYIAHYLRHRIRPLWHFHTIHHAQRDVNPFTTKRTHIVEELFARGVVRWIPLALMGSAPEVWLVYYWYDAVWDYFVHSNVRVPYGPLKYLLVSPQFHRLHHSSLPQHADKNFADHLALWDVIFGTASFDYEQEHPTGVPNVPFEQESSVLPHKVAAAFARQWWYPFRMVGADLRRGQLFSGPTAAHDASRANAGEALSAQ
jgi:sterol desaturase/sphingolipid hydroxylase (fatty acid hydroxylase superfamily)